MVPLGRSKAALEYEALLRRVQDWDGGAGDSFVSAGPARARPPVSIPVDYKQHVAQLRSARTHAFMSDLRSAISAQMSGSTPKIDPMVLASRMRKGPAPFLPVPQLVPQGAMSGSVSGGGESRQKAQAAETKGGRRSTKPKRPAGEPRRTKPGEASRSKPGSRTSRKPKPLAGGPRGGSSRSVRRPKPAAAPKKSRARGRNTEKKGSASSTGVSSSRVVTRTQSEATIPVARVPGRGGDAKGAGHGKRSVRAARAPHGISEEDVPFDRALMKKTDAEDVDAVVWKERERRAIAQEKAQHLQFLLENQQRVQSSVDQRLRHPNYFIQKAKEQASELRSSLFPLLREAEVRLDGLVDQFFIPPTNPLLKRASKAMGRAIATNVDALADMLLDDLLEDAADNLNRCEAEKTEFEAAANAEDTIENALEIAEKYRSEVESIRNRYLGPQGQSAPPANGANGPVPSQPPSDSGASSWEAGPGPAKRPDAEPKRDPATFDFSAEPPLSSEQNSKERLVEMLMREYEAKEASGPGPDLADPSERAQPVADVKASSNSGAVVEAGDEKRPADEKRVVGWAREVVDRKNAYMAWRAEQECSIKDRIGVTMSEVVSMIADDFVENAVDSVSDEVDGMLDESISKVASSEFQLRSRQ